MIGSVNRRRTLRYLVGGAMSSALPGCASLERGAPVPAGRAWEATVLGLANERFYPVHDLKPLEAEFIAAVMRQAHVRGARSPDELPGWQALAISGGGEAGAFGAGLLCGWTEAGTRPDFNLVTGISTGALTAPFAFLGSTRDRELRRVYTDVSAEQILKARNLMVALFGDAMADNAPLFGLISGYVNESMLADVARAYDSGKLLFIATTDLDAQQPVIWNIGAIAKSGHPRSLDTVRRVLLASAAIPGAFPPTMFDVSVGDERYQEMHVDGGTIAQTFLYPSALTVQRRERIAAGKPVLSANAYVIRNGRLDPDWSGVERRTLNIAGRAISTMIATGGYNDVMNIYKDAVRDAIGYNLAFIQRDFDSPLPAPFDPVYMRALFEYAYGKARQGYDWAKKPPGIA